MHKARPPSGFYHFDRALFDFDFDNEDSTTGICVIHYLFEECFDFHVAAAVDQRVRRQHFTQVHAALIAVPWSITTRDNLKKEIDYQWFSIGHVVCN